MERFELLPISALRPSTPPGQRTESPRGVRPDRAPVLSMRTDRHPADPASLRSRSDGHGSRPSARIPDISALAAPTGLRVVADNDLSLPLPTWSRSASRPAAGSSLHEPTTGRAATLALPGVFGRPVKSCVDHREALTRNLKDMPAAPVVLKRIGNGDGRWWGPTSPNRGRTGDRAAAILYAK